MNRNQQLANFLSVITLIGVIALPLIAVMIWLFWDYFAPYVAANLPTVFNLGDLSVSDRLIGFTVSLLGAAVQAYGLLGLRTTFVEASRGNPLSDNAIRGFRRFALVTLVMVFIGIIQRTGLIVLFSLSDPLHQGRLDVQFGTTELKALFMGVLLFFVAHVFAEGKRAKDENQAFV